MQFKSIILKSYRTSTELKKDGFDYFVDNIIFRNDEMSITFGYDAFGLNYDSPDLNIIYCDSVEFCLQEPHNFNYNLFSYDQIDFYKNDDLVEQIVSGDKIVSCIRTEEGIVVKYIVSDNKEDDTYEILVDRIRFK